MTQHGSFPGRPRGRRARQDNDASEWQGYDATPQDQREFPDLAPIRPREARARDGRIQGDQQAPQPGGYGAYPGAGGPGHPQGGQQQGGGYGQPGGTFPGGYGGHAGQAQSPWPDAQQPQAQPPWPDAQQYQTQQYQAAQYQAPQYPGGRPEAQQSGAQPPSAQQHPGQSPAAPQAQAPHAPRKQDEQAPSWAEPDSDAEFAERWRRRGLEERDEQRAGGRKRRRLLITGGAVIALAIAVTVYLLEGGPGAANLGFGNLVTSFLPGELQQVPDPCTTMPSSLLNQYLPGTRKQVAQPLNSGKNTQCTWTLDSPPTYRVLDVTLQAYSPSGLASGDGSATYAALDAFQSAENGYISPGKNSGQPKATVTDLTGMPGGSKTSAFQATQVFNRSGAVTDVASVYVRYRNVIVTVVLDGLDQSSGSKKYGPVSMSQLSATAQAMAREMASQIAK